MDPKAITFIFGAFGTAAVIGTLGSVGLSRGAYVLFRNVGISRRYNSFVEYNPHFGKQLNDLEKKEAFEILETKFNLKDNQSFGTSMDRQRRILDAIDEFGKGSKYD